MTSVAAPITAMPSANAQRRRTENQLGFSCGGGASGCSGDFAVTIACFVERRSSFSSSFSGFSSFGRSRTDAREGRVAEENLGVDAGVVRRPGETEDDGAEISKKRPFYRREPHEKS